MKFTVFLALLAMEITNVYSDDIIECTEFNKTRQLTELDIREIVKEITKFNLPKLSAKVDELNSNDVGDESRMLMVELVERYNYNVETHVVTTADGYVLTTFRIPRKGPAVFLMHGLLGSSIDWVIAGPNRSLAYLLADEGYDVWIGNSRGNSYSTKHMVLTADCEEFWNYSFDEIGRYDLLAMIEYAIDASQKDNISFIGQNQGSTAFFVMCAEFPRFCEENVSIMIALAPVAFVSHTKSPILKILSYETDVKYILLKAIGSHKIIPSDDFIKEVASNICDHNAMSQLICSKLNFVLFGFDQGQLEIDDVPSMLDHISSIGSTKQFLHYAQEIESGLFRKYDYDETTNINMYGSLNPPNYNLENITVPIALLYSNEDWFSNITDVDLLKEKLAHVIEYGVVRNYNYIDWLMARNIKQKIYDNVLKLIEHYSGVENDLSDE